MERRLALATVVAKLTVMLTLQLMEASKTFIIVQIAIIFFDRRICSKLSLGLDVKSTSDLDEALMIIF